MINVFIIDDSMFMRNTIIKILKHNSNFKIIGDASNPIDAMQKFKDEGLPDVIILDLEMPKMDGITFLEKMKNERIIPTVVLSSHTKLESPKALRALELGAKAVLSKPTTLSDDFVNDLVLSIEKANFSDSLKTEEIKEDRRTSKIIAIGASTGGVQTLEKIFTSLKPSHPPIVVTQHMPEGFTSSFANRLNKSCPYSNIKEVKNKEIIGNGDIFISPGNYHLEIERTKNNKFQVVLKDYPKVSNHKPSVDVLFKSIAIHGKEDAIAFILTGMGKDGALGIKKVRDAGGMTYGQDKETSMVYGMPKAALKLGGLDKQVSLNEVIDIINNIK